MKVSCWDPCSRLSSRSRHRNWPTNSSLAVLLYHLRIKRSNQIRSHVHACFYRWNQHGVNPRNAWHKFAMPIFFNKYWMNLSPLKWFLTESRHFLVFYEVGLSPLQSWHLWRNSPAQFGKQWSVRARTIRPPYKAVRIPVNVNSKNSHSHMSIQVATKLWDSW